MHRPEHQTYSFDEFHLDLTRGCLFRGTLELKLRPQSFEVLKYLAANSGRLVGKNELIESVWNGMAVTDDSLVQCLKDIRRALGDETQQIIKTVPRRGYIFESEISENGRDIYVEETRGVHLVIEETSDLSETPGRSLVSGTSRSARFTDTVKRHRVFAASATVVLIALIIAGAVFSKPILSWWFTPPSIAVLPIVNTTGDAGLDYVSDGLTESVITSLMRLNTPGAMRLRVSPQNTVFLFKNNETDPLGIGRRLGVNSVLASKMSQENNMRIFKFELINVADGSVSWSKQYAVSWSKPHMPGINANEEILAMQNEIPKDIAAQLPVGLSDADRQVLTRRYTQNPEAYDLYLKGRAEFRNAKPSGLRRSIDYYQQALDIDAEFATAYWAMGVSYRMQGTIDERPDKEAAQLAVDCMKKALKIDNTLAPAVNAVKLADFDALDWKAIEKAGPSHPAYRFYLQATGRMDEVLDEQKRLLKFEPLAPSANFVNCLALYSGRKYDEALAQCQKTINLRPDGRPYFGPESPWIHLAFSNIYAQTGKFDEAIAEINSAIELAEGSEAMMAMQAYVYARAGRRDDAVKILNFLHGQIARGEYVPAQNIAYVYANLGERDQAFAWLNKAVDEGEGRLVGLRTDPEFDPLRDDPRFPELLRRLKLPE